MGLQMGYKPYGLGRDPMQPYEPHIRQKIWVLLSLRNPVKYDEKIDQTMTDRMGDEGKGRENVGIFRERRLGDSRSFARFR